MNWLWAYFRRKTTEALLAGVHDALVGAPGTVAPAAELTGAPPPQLAAPQPNSPQALTDQTKRGPGRPRKFQEPPA